MFVDHLDYTITLPVFEGPLELLLRLIEREELDITSVALAHVARTVPCSCAFNGSAGSGVALGHFWLWRRVCCC
jgi:hypothetical protein